VNAVKLGVEQHVLQSSVAKVGKSAAVRKEYEAMNGKAITQ
jgi:hypothetical protein